MAFVNTTQVEVYPHAEVEKAYERMVRVDSADVASFFQWSGQARFRVVIKF
jgi:hypothetical protein